MAFTFKNKNILIISPEAWGTNHVSKHHYARELQKQGGKVWFVNPPEVSNIETMQEVGKDLFVVKHPVCLRGKNRLPSFVSRVLHRKEIKRLVHITGKPDVLWSFDPYRFQWLSDFGAQVHIYHTVDRHYSAYREYIAAEHADIVFATAPSLFEHLKPHNGNHYYVPHGCIVREKNINARPSFSLPGNNKIKACYVGNFYKVLDLPLIVKLIEENRDVDFVFIGPVHQSNLGPAYTQTGDFFRLYNQINTFFLGEMPPEVLHDYLTASDINFVAYNSVQVNPHKIMSYLYSGKVTVTTPIEVYSDTDLLLQAQSGKGFLRLFETVKQNLEAYNSKTKMQERIAFASRHTYKSLVSRIEHLIALTVCCRIK